MTDLATTLGTDPNPATTELDQGEAIPAGSGLSPLPAGVHPRDNAVATSPDGRVLYEPDRPPGEGNLGPQGFRRNPPWNIENEQAVPVFQRAADDWIARTETLSSSNPIMLAGRLKGCVSTSVWVPATASFGVLIAPTEGEVNQGAGVELDPGDSVTLPTEAAVWAGVIGTNATGGPVKVLRMYNPPGGGLGLSSV